MRNGYRHLKRRLGTNQKNIRRMATPTTATAISTVHPLCPFKANHSNRSDSHRQPFHGEQSKRSPSLA